MDYSDLDAAEDCRWVFAVAGIIAAAAMVVLGVVSIFT